MTVGICRATLLIGFSLGAVFHDPDFRLSSSTSQAALKAYAQPSTATP
jgi:hypothetical protein